jgi:hypothetical protein
MITLHSLYSPPVPVGQLVSYGFSGSSCAAEFPAFVPPPLSGAAELGEKIRSSLPVLFNSKPFRHYYRRARELRAGHSVKWNDRLLSDSLEASKMADGVSEGAVLSLLWPAESGPAFSDLESGYSDGSAVDDASLPNSHGSDIPLQISLAKMGEKLTPEWEEEVREKTAGLCESLSKIWTVTEEHGERFKVIVEESIKCQKMKGKRELLNLQSFIIFF